MISNEDDPQPNATYPMQVNGINLTIIHEYNRNRNIQHSHHTLNDDCLYETFKYLDYADLRTLKSTCRLFNDLANELIRKKHRAIISTEMSAMSKVQLWRIEDFLCHAGDVITKAVISNETYRKAIITALILEHCNNITELNCHIADNKPLDDYFRFFHGNAKIQKLSIWGSRFNCNKSIVCPNLILPHIHLPELKVLFIEYTQLKKHMIQPFLECNPQIEEIWLFNVDIGNTVEAVEMAFAIWELRNLKSMTYITKHGDDMFVQACRRMFESSQRDILWCFRRRKTPPVSELKVSISAEPGII